MPVSEPDEGVTVIGTGKVSMRPDILVAQLGVELAAQSAQEALDRCSAATTRMIDALRSVGVADGDRQTVTAALRQDHDKIGRFRGWTATQNLTARLRDLGRTGEMISSAIAAGGDASRLYAIGFDADDDAAAKVEARRLAFADARARAGQYAELAGRKLGAVLAVRETEGVLPPPVRMFAVGSAPMPVEEGELDVSITVEVRWALAN